MGLIDTHCHLDAAAFDNDFPAMIERARSTGVEALVAVGVAPEAWATQLQRARQSHTMGMAVGLALGIHPWWAEGLDIEKAVAALDRWLAVPESHGCERRWLLGIGEIGLDFAGGMPDARLQKRLFESQLDLAEHHRLPLILHAHKSEDRLLWYLRRRAGLRGVVHGFTGSLQQAEVFIEQGFLLGIGGSITHPGAHRMHRLVRELPLQSMLIETDAPNQPGHEHRGERNEPAWLGGNLQALAECRAEPVEQVAAQTRANALGLFGKAWLVPETGTRGHRDSHTEENE